MHPHFFNISKKLLITFLIAFRKAFGLLLIIETLIRLYRFSSYPGDYPSSGDLLEIFLGSLILFWNTPKN